jgi:hypothetical protein
MQKKLTIGSSFWNFEIKETLVLGFQKKIKKKKPSVSMKIFKNSIEKNGFSKNANFKDSFCH